MAYHAACILLLATLCLTDDPTLRFAIEVVHHGARSSPVTNFNTTEKLWDSNHKMGELTNVGLREAYLLGRVFRERYIHKADIMKEKYDDYQIKVKTAPYNAAIMTGMAQMMGFYTPGVGETLTEMEQAIGIPPVEDISVVEKEMKDLRDAGLPYYTQTLPIHTYEGSEDWIFSTLTNCNIIKYMWANISQSKESEALNDKYANLYASMNAKAKINITQMYQAYMLYDDLICDLADDQSLREEFKFDTDVMDMLRDLSNDFWKHIIFGNSTILLAAVTELYREWITHFENVVKNDNENKKVDQTLNFALYVSDASLLIPILNLFGVQMNNPVEFADNFVLQMGLKQGAQAKLKKELKDYEMTAFFNGNSLQFRGNLWFPADEFVRELTTHSLLHLTKAQFVDWCNYQPYIPPTPPTPNQTASYKWVWISFGIELAVLIAIFFACFALNRNKSQASEQQVIEGTNNEEPSLKESKESQVKAL